MPQNVILANTPFVVWFIVRPSPSYLHVLHFDRLSKGDWKSSTHSHSHSHSHLYWNVWVICLNKRPVVCGLISSRFDSLARLYNCQVQSGSWSWNWIEAWTSALLLPSAAFLLLLSPLWLCADVCLCLSSTCHVTQHHCRPDNGSPTIFTRTSPQLASRD